MTLLAGTVDLATLRTDLDAQTATITANKKLGQLDQWVSLSIASCINTTNLLSRSVAWTQQDDAELRCIFLSVTDGTASRVVKAKLTVDNDTTPAATRFLADKTIEVSVTTIIGAASGVQTYTDATGTRVKLLRGVRYRLEIEVVTAATVTGPLQAAVQLRSIRRGGAGGPAFVPHALRSFSVVDSEAINQDLKQIARDIRDSMARRYTTSIQIVPVSIDFADTAVLREFPIRRRAAAALSEVIGVELVGTSVTAAVVATLTQTGDTRWPAITVTGEGADAEVYSSSGVPTTVDSNSVDEVFRLALSGAGTFVGYLVLHVRCDRWLQPGATPNSEFVPALLDATTSTAIATLNAQTTAIALGAVLDAAAASDCRCAIFVADDLAAGLSKTWIMPGGAGLTPIRLEVYVVAAATVTGRVTLVGGTTLNTDLVGTGITTRAQTGTASSLPAVGTDPTADTLTVTLKNQAGAADVLKIIAVLWFA